MKKENNKKVVVSKEKKKKQLVEFIKTHVFKKTKILSVVGIILFLCVISVFITSSMDTSSELEIIEKTSLLNDLKQRAVIILLILFAGWVPYFYIPAIAFGAYVFMLAGDVAFAMETKGIIAMLLLNLLPLMLDILTVSIITAIGIYMCSYATKKYIYNQRTSFSFLDVKIHLYQITKKQKKYDEAMAKKQERIDKIKENDVKIDYSKIVKIVPVVMCINLITCIIEHLINN